MPTKMTILDRRAKEAERAVQGAKERLRAAEEAYHAACLERLKETHGYGVGSIVKRKSSSIVPRISDRKAALRYQVESISFWDEGEPGDVYGYRLRKDGTPSKRREWIGLGEFLEAA